MTIVKKHTAAGGAFSGYWHEEEARWATQAEYEATYMKSGSEKEAEADTEVVDLEKLTKAQLSELLTERGIEHSPHLNKAQLIELVQPE